MAFCAIIQTRFNRHIKPEHYYSYSNFLKVCRGQQRLFKVSNLATILNDAIGKNGIFKTSDIITYK